MIFYCLGLFPLMSDDLVNCFHLLICCVDCICTNLMADDELRVFLHDRYKSKSALQMIFIVRNNEQEER